jgi:hypothetical protein
MLYVYDAQLEINSQSAKNCVDHSDEYIQKHVLVRKNITKLWFFYKYSHKILLPLTINYNDRTDQLLLSPGINRYFGQMLTGLPYARVRFFSTIEYKYCANRIQLKDVQQTNSYLPVILQKLNNNDHYNIEVKDDKKLYYNYHSTISQGVNVYCKDKLLFYVGHDPNNKKSIHLEDQQEFTKILIDVFNQVETLPESR